jgi:hypothetical protein
MTRLKPFQKATVQAVLETFRRQDGPRRFLVADEVGLGKTLVAQQIVRELCKYRRKPLVVFYVCSSLSIASQNKARLLEVLPEAERSQVACPVDRLTLMPAARRPTHPKLNLYTLTPGTSVPVRRGIRRDGHQDERALIHALVEEIWPAFLKERGKDFFQRSAHATWEQRIKTQREKVQGNGHLLAAFRKSARIEFELEKRQRLVPALRQRKDPLDIIARFRNALAASALEEIQPDLVIFDEFQRFRDLLNPQKDRAAARIVGKLYGDGLEDSSALLLLSATPYRLFTRRWEDTPDSSHHNEFYDLIDFLYGRDDLADRKQQECKDALTEFQKELRKGEPNSRTATEARDRVQAILRPIMARTERSSLSASAPNKQIAALPADLVPDDLHVYRHLTQSFDNRHQSSSVYYWTSIPMPMQTMGNAYITWRNSDPAPADGVPVLSESERNRFQRKAEWPHPRLRSLQENLASTDRLALPWIAPSLPWWPLGGGWEADGETSSKLLIFSRFRAVPQAVSALLSYDLETRLFEDQKLKYAEITRRKALQPRAGRQALLALFNPWPWLIEATEPLSARSRTLDDIRQHLAGQIGEALAQIGIPISDEKRKRPPGPRQRLRGQESRRTIWQLLAQIEARAGNWSRINNAWERLARSLRRAERTEAGLGRLLPRWDKEAHAPISFVTPSQARDLADYALSSPGVVLGRALKRHWANAVSAEGYYDTLETSWRGLRTYLDQRWFFTALKTGSEDSYPDAIRQAVVDGNLEAVLDEHLWITSQIRSLKGRALARELRDSLNLRSSPFYFHQADDRSDDRRFSLRCHAALPFIQTQSRAEQRGPNGQRELSFRPDELRRSFNSPFWPHILATTSVGQEGLDFHVWCNSLVHWDLCSNPVDLEQREGRIQRYGGLAIRQTIAGKLGDKALRTLKPGESPWHKLERLAERHLGHPSGLAPWWVCDGAEIERYIFDVPLSEQAQRLQWVQEQRLLYRLVLGQPNQEDLIEVLSRQIERNDLDESDFRQTMLQLSPWFGDQS